MNRERVRNYRKRHRQNQQECIYTEKECNEDSITGNDFTITPSITRNDSSITESLPLININNRTEKKKEEHTSLQEERENKKESTVTENDNGENLSISREERDFENSFSSVKAVCDTAVDRGENTALPSPLPTKSAYGAFDNVLLTDTEYDAFAEKFPEDYADRIDELSIYLATSGKEYKNHYATLLSFAKTRLSFAMKSDLVG